MRPIADYMDHLGTCASRAPYTREPYPCDCELSEALGVLRADLLSLDFFRKQAVAQSDDPEDITTLRANELTEAQAKLKRYEYDEQQHRIDAAEKRNATEICAAHPMLTGDHDTYQRAMLFVGERHEKYEIVDLVNWLLARCTEAQAALAEVHKRVCGHDCTACGGWTQNCVPALQQRAEAAEARVADLQRQLDEAKALTVIVDGQRLEAFGKMDAYRQQLEAERKIHRITSSELHDLRIAYGHERTASKEYEYAGNLVAAVHRDGGHYISKHGWKKAVDDAVAIYVADRMVREAAERDLVTANQRIAELDQQLASERKESCNWCGSPFEDTEDGRAQIVEHLPQCEHNPQRATIERLWEALPKPDSEGLQLGNNCWVNFKKVTGGSGPVTTQAFYEWVDSIRAILENLPALAATQPSPLPDAKPDTRKWGICLPDGRRILGICEETEGAAWERIKGFDSDLDNKPGGYYAVRVDVEKEKGHA